MLTGITTAVDPTPMARLKLIACVSAASFVLTSAAGAQNPAGGDGTARAALGRLTASTVLYIAPANMTVRICFSGGNPGERLTFMAAAAEWSTAASLSFDGGQAPTYRTCGPGQPISHLRVAFEMTNRPSHAVLGALVDHSEGTRPNVVIKSFAPETPGRVLDAIKSVSLHEIGHAIGLTHQHQHPNSSCFRSLDWPKICSSLPDLKTQPNSSIAGVIRATYLPHVGPPVGGSAFAYDPASIMHYRLDSTELRYDSPTCHSAKTETLSDGDKARAAYLYPPTQGAQSQVIRSFGYALAKAIVSAPEMTAAAAARMAREAEAIVGRNHPNAGFKVDVPAQSGFFKPDGPDRGQAVLSGLAHGRSSDFAEMCERKVVRTPGRTQTLIMKVPADRRVIEPAD
jgi:hypothetical protein